MRNHGIYEISTPEGPLYIDLGKIVTVSKAQFVDQMGHGGYFAEAIIECQLMIDPVVLRWEQRWEFQDKENHRRPIPFRAKDGIPTQVAALQLELDKLIEAWKKFNEEEK